MQAQYMAANDVAGALGVSRSKAYQIIRTLNKELDKQGYIIIAGKCPIQYFKERCYGIKE